MLISTIKAFANALLRHAALAGKQMTSPVIERRIPHDKDAFTQGLAVYRGCLFESTGLDERSSLRQTDLGTGRVLRSVPIAGHFAEGLAILDDQIFLNTWKSGVVLTFDPETFTQSGELRNPDDGWGLASTGTALLCTNGTHVLRARDAGFRDLWSVKARSRGLPVRHLNDIEVVDDRVFANIWYWNKLIVLSLDTGNVRYLVDCADIVEREQRGDRHKILNGIAYDSQTSLFYLTGKKWAHVYEVRIPSL